jgi:hypothetical protein
VREEGRAKPRVTVTTKRIDFYQNSIVPFVTRRITRRKEALRTYPLLEELDTFLTLVRAAVSQASQPLACSEALEPQLHIGHRIRG